MALLLYALWQCINALHLFPSTLRVSTSDGRIVAKKMALEGGTKLYTQGMYDYNNMQLVKLLAAGGLSPLLDIGANLGLYSLLATEAPQVCAIAFEPHPHTFKVLQEQIALNSRTSITPVNLAVSDTPGSVAFTDDAGSSVNHIVEQATGTGLIQVQACRIDDFCREQGVRPLLVKMDVEGFELGALRGFGDLLSQVQVLLIEISKHHSQVHELLTQHGLVGPYKYEARARHFYPAVSSHSLEDPVYLRASFLSQLKNEFNIEAASLAT